MNDKLEKLINIIQKTGQNVIFPVDYNFDDFCVILALKDYEKLLSAKASVKHLTEEELADKINRDIAIWKSEQEQYDFDLNYDDFKQEHDSEQALENFFDNETKKHEKADEVIDEFVEEERIEEFVDDGFDSIASILNQKETEILAEEINVDNEGKPKAWSIPKDRKKQAQEIAGDKQYLEEISF